MTLISGQRHSRRKAPYLTHSVNTDIPFVVGAGGAVFDLAGHGEEEVKVFRNAVQLTDVFIYAHGNASTRASGTVKKEKRRRGALFEPAGLPPHLNTMLWTLTRALSSVLLLCAQPLLGRGQERLRAVVEAPVGGGGGFLLRYRFIWEFRSVITGKSGQPSLIKINDGEGDLAQRSQEPVHNLFFPTSPPIHQQLKQAWDDGQTQCSPSLRSLASWNKAGP